VSGTYTPLFLPGDDIFSQSRGWLPYMIRKLTGGRWEPKTPTNHMAKVLQPAPGDDPFGALIIEANWHVDIHPFRQAYTDRGKVSVWRFVPTPIIEPTDARFRAVAWSYHKKRYPWYRLPLFAIDAGLAWLLKARDRDVVLARHLMKSKGRPVCSQLAARLTVAQWGRAIPHGRPYLGLEPDWTSPDDAWDEHAEMRSWGRWVPVWPADGSFAALPAREVAR
jgi:hypothetical protein